MKKFKILLSAIAIIFFAISCNQEPKPEALDMAAIEAEIQALETAYAAAENARDVDGILVYYAEDAVNMPNNQPVVAGKEAIKKRLEEGFAQGENDGSITFNVESIKAAGNLVIEAGSSVYTDEDGEVSTGKYISIFEKRNGKYVCIRDIWNNDKKYDDDDDDDDDDEDDEDEDEDEDEDDE